MDGRDGKSEGGRRQQRHDEIRPEHIVAAGVSRGHIARDDHSGLPRESMEEKRSRAAVEQVGRGQSGIDNNDDARALRKAAAWELDAGPLDEDEGG